MVALNKPHLLHYTGVREKYTPFIYWGNKVERKITVLENDIWIQRLNQSVDAAHFSVSGVLIFNFLLHFAIIRLSGTTSNNTSITEDINASGLVAVFHTDLIFATISSLGNFHRV